MKWFFILMPLILQEWSVMAQSESYSIESFQDEYTELSEYESISTIFEGIPLWEYEFQLEFQFPFYETNYDRLIYRSDAWGSVTDEEDEALYLMNYNGGYSYPPLEDPNNIESDVRFGHILISNMQAFVIQYTKVRFFADLFKDSLNTYMNFQLWFFENGVMEVHFGEMHMDGTPIYKPGKGFYCFTSDEGIDTTEVCGPRLGISNPLDIEDGIAIKGAYDDFEVTSDIYDNLTVLPPQGWVIRFKPKTLGIFQPEYQINEFAVSPNPASSIIQFPDIKGVVAIHSLSGAKMYEGLPYENKLDISAFPQGIYFVKAFSDKGTMIGRFTKF
jgi:hypothetical protein